MRSRHPGAFGRNLWGGLATIAAVGLLSPRPALALDSDAAYRSASQQITSVASALNAIQQAVRKSQNEERSPAQRIADAVLLMGSKDYTRAANVLNEVIEKYPNDPTAFADGMSLLGETYFRSKQYLSARRVFKTIVDKGSDPRFSIYQEKALGRLVDVALRTRDFSSLDDIFASMSKVSQSTVSSGLAYARGKGLFVKKDYGGAKASLATVDAQSEYAHQARYMLGLVAV